MANNNSTKKITAKDVATFLADNPDSITDLLATHPKLLAPYLAAADDPDRDNKQIDPKVVDLSPALTFKARHDARKIKQTHDSLLHVAAENMLSWTRIHHAALGLLASTDLPGMCEVITNEFPVIFDLNQCQLIIEEEMAIQNVTDIGLVRHPANRIAVATNSRSLYLGLPRTRVCRSLRATRRAPQGVVRERGHTQEPPRAPLLRGPRRPGTECFASITE